MIVEARFTAPLLARGFTLLWLTADDGVSYCLVYPTVSIHGRHRAWFQRQRSSLWENNKVKNDMYQIQKLTETEVTDHLFVEGDRSCVAPAWADQSPSDLQRCAGQKPGRPVVHIDDGDVDGGAVCVCFRHRVSVLEKCKCRLSLHILWKVSKDAVKEISHIVLVLAV